jgi:hypothetical protein
VIPDLGALGDALRDIDSVFEKPSRWDALIRRGREADLLGTLADRLETRGRLDEVPLAPRKHLMSARMICTAQHTAVRREVREIVAALQPIGVEPVLLKGAAYLFAGLPLSRGRLFSDVDILVPKPALPSVESALMLAGYATTHHHPYDQRYYRRWMHELPPMQHVKRLTVLDVHHAIVPETARARHDPALLVDAATPIAGGSGVRVLAPADLVLHSATHLFHNEDFTHGLRDLVDIDQLLRHFGSDAGFWPRLTQRAVGLNVTRPLFYALRWSTRVLATPVPRETMQTVSRDGPGFPVRPLMDSAVSRALVPDLSRKSTRLARLAMFVHGHWLKMPLPLLAWHLTVKALRRDRPSEPDDGNAAAPAI